MARAPLKYSLRIWWRLDANDKPVPVDREDVDWGNRWHIRSYPMQGMQVSTIFMAIDHNYGDGPPVLFETMAFSVDKNGCVDITEPSQHPWHEYQERYTTKRRAENGHAIICAAIKNGQVPDDLQGAWGVDPGLM